jgi:lysophospholipase L1-like esterase
VRRALLVLLGLCSGLALAELAVRVLDVPPRPLEALHLPSYRLSDDPVLRYEYRPNLRPEDEPYDALHQGFATNSLGFRDVEFPLHKPAGEVRILALGDSTTAGNGIADLADTWPRQLERRFAESGRAEVRVLNLGVGGYHPLQAARLLELRGEALAPDLVLLLVCLNDLDPSADGGIRRQLERVRARGGDAAPGPLAALLRVSRLAFVVAHRTRALGLAELEPEPRMPVRDSENPLADGLALLARLQQERGLRVVALLLPGLRQPFTRYPHAALHRRMAEIAARTPEIPWVDLLDDFRESGADPRRFTVDGLHPNRAGAAVLAEIVYRRLAAAELP